MQWRANPNRQVSVATKVCSTGPNICGVHSMERSRAQNFEVAAKFLEKMQPPVVRSSVFCNLHHIRGGSGTSRMKRRAGHIPQPAEMRH